MFSKSWIRIAFVLCMCAIVAAGCKTKPKPAPIPDEGLTPIPGDGSDIGMTDRSADTGAEITVKFENVLFSYDSFQVTESEAAKVASVAEFMKSKPDIKLTCEGNCDERGSAEYNMSLGEHRAQAVRAALVGVGIDAARIQTKSYGREQPIDARHCEEAWRQNRRVEFKLYQ